MATEMEIKELDIYDDSLLVIKQHLKEYEVKKDDLMLYHKYALWLLNKLETVKLEHIPRSANKMDGALANLTATLALRGKERANVVI